MPDTAPEIIFSNLHALSDEIVSSADGAAGTWNYRIAVSSWPLSVKPTNEDQVWDYFLVEFTGQSSVMGNNGALKGYALTVRFGENKPFHDTTPAQPAPSIMPMHLTMGEAINNLRIPDGALVWTLPEGLELVATSPDTTVATTSYTDSTSTTVGGSLGFFGGDLTGSISASTTIGSSTTRSVSDLTIENRSGMEDNVSCWWIYQVQPGSKEAEGDTPILAQFLVRRHRSEDDLPLTVGMSALMDGTSILFGQLSGAIQAVQGGPAPTPADPAVTVTNSFSGAQWPALYLDNTAALSKQHPLTIKAPPAPPTA